MDDPAPGQPSAALPPTVCFLPLGGLGEIGMNCFALEQSGELLIVDCGATFPDDDIGEDLIVPDMTMLVERQADIAGIFITHGHEDHIAALPYLLRLLKRSVPIYAPAHAAALICARFEENSIFDADVRVVEPEQRYSVGSFVVEPIRVAHSIVQATALCIDTVAGRIVHTADFDLDTEQPAGWLTDEGRLRQLGGEGVLLLLSDSTNVVSECRERNEGDVGRALFAQVRSARRRVVVSLFSSNAHRLAALIDAAVVSDRKLCLLGRSLRRHFDIAKRLGHLSYPSNLLVAPETLAGIAPENVLVVAGGTQGEPNSAMRKLAQGKHPQLQLEQGDRVIFSSRVIPGNEKRVFTMHNDLLRQKVDLVTGQQVPEVHVSGHASKRELKTMLEWVRPAVFVPVHGTLLHMTQHAALAQDCGVSITRVAENGARVAISSAGEVRLAGRFQSGVKRLTSGGEELDNAIRRRRFLLARNGVLSISFQLDRMQRVAGAIKIDSRGVAGVDRDEGAHNVISSCVRRTVEGARGIKMRSLEAVVTQAVRSVVNEMCSERPTMLVHVLEPIDHELEASNTQSEMQKGEDE